MMFERLITGCLLALAVFWTGASFFLRADGVPDWWLPASLTIGVGAAATLRPAALPKKGGAPAPRWAVTALLLVVATCFAATVYGAVATPSRHWDGAASFDAKVFWLTKAPVLQQPFFAADGVFHHSPDYPLLQALLVACADRLMPGFGRALMPLLYLLLCAVVATALRRRAVRPLLRVAVTAAIAVTPSLLSSSGGAVDSGYSELSLLLATTTIAAGLLNGAALWFGLGLGLAVVTKPEGAFYALGALAVVVARGDRVLTRAAFVALLLASLTWLPVRAALLHAAVSPAAPIAFAAAALSAAALVRLTRSCRRPERARWLMLLTLPLVGLLALPWLAPLFATDSGLGVYLRQADRALTGLGNLPAYLAAFFDYGVARMRLGAALLFPLAALAVAAATRRRLSDG
ncbi:MAG: hypothetical protein VX044_09395, partial [Planctomycetota bacterium]|nr:hypothetical protein [Planctomycetota bacterium]